MEGRGEGRNAFPHLFNATLTTSYNSQSKKLVYKGVDFYVQNAVKLAYEHR